MPHSMQYCPEDIPSYRQKTPLGQEQPPEMTIRTCTILYIHSYAQAQWQSGHREVESNVTRLEYARALARATKMADRCTSSFEANSVALQKGSFTQKTLV